MPEQTRHTAADVERILNSLKCLTCGYELRGQSGDIVRCPECGRQHNIANLVINEWRGRWYHAPGFGLLALPLLAPIAWCFLIGIAGVLFQNQFDLFVAIAFVSLVLAALVWIWLITVAVRKYQSRVGFLLTFMIQLIFPLYLVGALFGLTSTFLIVDSLSGGLSSWVPVIRIVVALLAVVLAWIVQRLFARLCIRVHIRKLSDEGTISA